METETETERQCVLARARINTSAAISPPLIVAFGPSEQCHSLHAFSSLPTCSRRGLTRGLV